ESDHLRHLLAAAINARKPNLKKRGQSFASDLCLLIYSRNQQYPNRWPPFVPCSQGIGALKFNKFFAGFLSVAHVHSK
uniref:Uncharacterized protein n=1 Tax=Triticum urartu TaxID=4572 RepID=A0A8R7PL90_TRIUA